MDSNCYKYTLSSRRRLNDSVHNVSALCNECAIANVGPIFDIYNRNAGSISIICVQESVNDDFCEVVVLIVE
jgi:hypothetical protein